MALLLHVKMPAYQLCDSCQWQVDIPRGGNAVWGRQLIADGLTLSRPFVTANAAAD